MRSRDEMVLRKIAETPSPAENVEVFVLSARITDESIIRPLFVKHFDLNAAQLNDLFASVARGDRFALGVFSKREAKERFTRFGRDLELTTGDHRIDIRFRYTTPELSKKD